MKLITLRHIVMKRIIFYSLLVFILFTCEKNNKIASEVLNISGIRIGDNKEVIKLRLKSSEITSSAIPCYVFASSIFDPVTKGFGYVDCYSHFNLINLLTGEIIYSYSLPGMLSQVVIDTSDYSIIGLYYENGSNYIVKVNLEDGTVITKKSIDLGEGIYATTYFFNPNENEYVLLKANDSLISINPNNGTIVKSIKVESNIQETYYDMTNNRLIGLTYSLITDQNYIVILDVETGDLISRVEIKERHDFHGGVSSFDIETNSYILISSENEILFIDIESGQIKDSYQIEFDITEFKFWRSI